MALVMKIPLPPAPFATYARRARANQTLVNPASLQAYTRLPIEFIPPKNVMCSLVKLSSSTSVSRTLPCDPHRFQLSILSRIERTSPLQVDG
jgi:hypothetical protein